VRLRARIDMIWALTTIGAVVVGVQLDGIRGAAIAHVVTFACALTVYAHLGGRNLGLSALRLFGPLRSVGLCVLIQALATASVTVGIEHGGASALSAGLAGAGAGVFAMLLAMRVLAPELVGEARSLLLAALSPLSTVVSPRH
jgi:hypothetical protein